MTLNEKIELAVWMCQHNNFLALTGSLMIYMKYGNILGREPHDIDFIVDVEEYLEDYSLILPPFITKTEDDYSNSTGYDVLKRFWIGDTKIEFIEANHFRYHEDYVGRDKYGKSNGIHKDFLEEFNASRSHNYNIKYALLSDLIDAKKQYFEEDENKEYLDKTYKDLQILEPILDLKDNYTREYRGLGKYQDKLGITNLETDYYQIIKGYITECWYSKTFEEDKSRKYIENKINDKFVKNNPENKEWFNFIQTINHYTKNNIFDKITNNDTCYNNYLSYKMKNILETLIYEHKIPEEIKSYISV